MPNSLRLLDFPWPLQTEETAWAVGLSKKVSGMPESRRASLAPVAVLERAPQYFGDLGRNQGKGCRERRVYTQIGGIQQVGVRSLLQGRNGAAFVGRIPGFQLGHHILLGPADAHRLEFRPAAAGPDIQPGIDIE